MYAKEEQKPTQKKNEYFRQCKDLEESVTSWIVQPWVIVGASYAGLQVNGFAGNLLGGELTGMWHPTGWRSFDGTLLPPRFEVLYLRYGSRILNPLNDLCHCHKVNVIVVGQHFIDPIQECVQVFGIILEPSRMEVQTERCSILIVMSIEVVIQEIVELIAGQNVGARIDHSATGQIFIIGGILTTIQFVHDHFPDSVRSGWARL